MEKNISQQIQVLINQFNAKNFDYVISKAKVTRFSLPSKGVV